MFSTLGIISNLLLDKGSSGKDKNTTAHFPPLNKNCDNQPRYRCQRAHRIRSENLPQAAFQRQRADRGSQSPLLRGLQPSAPPENSSPPLTRPCTDNDLTNMRTQRLQVEPETLRDETTVILATPVIPTPYTVLSEGQPRF